MKVPFRFFRGELNGFYLYKLVTFLNQHIFNTGILDELVYNARMQWKLEDEVTAGELPIREEDIYNIGKIGGLFQPRTLAQTSLGSIWFTPSHVVNGKERSERGLLDMDYESFIFVRVEHDDYPDDIASEASERRRMSYVEQGAELIGYIPAGAELYDAEGNINTANIQSEPPEDAAYIEFYGQKYLTFEQMIDKELPLTVDVYKMLFECLQRIRRRGASLAGFIEVTQILGGGYVKDIEIVQNNYWFNVLYTLDDNVQVYNRERRYIAWLNICRMKFKEFVLMDRSKI